MNDDTRTREQFVEELEAALRRIEELERATADFHWVTERLQRKVAEQELLLHSIPVLVYFKDREHRYRSCNQAFADTANMSVEAISGKTDFELFPQADAEAFVQGDEAVMTSGEPQLNVEEPLVKRDGSHGWAAAYKIPYRDTNGSIIGLIGISLDITERKLAEEALRRREAELREVIAQQERLIETIRQLSTPVLPVAERILILPLISHIDSARSEQITEALLAGIQRHHAAIVIIDITGVPIVDTAIANHLIQATQAASLLGAQCMLVGISPEIAQTLVQLGVDVSRIMTRSNLQAGVAYAIRRLQAHQPLR